MNPTSALERLAFYARKTPGLGSAIYPATGVIPPYPALVLFWDETSITDGQEQNWVMTVRGQLFVAQKGVTEKEIARADPLIAALVDTFSPSNMNARTLLDPANGQRVSHCRIDRVRPSQEIGYAGHQHYGAEIFFNVKLWRFAHE